MPYTLHHTPHTDAFLATKQLRLKADTIGDGTQPQIVNAKGHRILRMLTGDEDGRPHIRFIINTTPSSTEFPQIKAARHLFSAQEAFDWLDALINALHQDIGDYTCSIKTGVTDTPLFESKGFVLDYARNRHVLVKHITQTPEPVDTRPVLPQATVDLLADLGMVYHPKTDELVTYNKTNRRRYTLCRIEWDRHRFVTTFNTSDSAKEYPRFLKDALSRDEHLARLEAIVKSIAAVHGPMRLVLFSGITDMDYLTENGYVWDHVGSPVWCKTITP